MAKIKLTKPAVDAAQPPGAGRRTQGHAGARLPVQDYAGERRKPALGLYGELTVEQARSLAQEWLAQVRRSGDSATDKAQARQTPTVTELCAKFMEDYSKKRNKPSTQAGYQAVINPNVIPLPGRK